MQNILSVVDLLHWNPHGWSQIILGIYGINFERRMLDNLLYEVGKSEIS
jgi:hypothetical protein